MKQEENRKRLIKFITAKDKFYEVVNFSAHSIEQLSAIKIRIENETESVSKITTQQNRK